LVSKVQIPNHTFLEEQTSSYDEQVSMLKFTEAKHVVDSDLREFHQNLILTRERALNNSDQQLLLDTESLIKLKEDVLECPAGPFMKRCRTITRQLEDDRRKRDPGSGRSLITRFLFILTRCTRLLPCENKDDAASCLDSEAAATPTSPKCDMTVTWPLREPDDLDRRASPKAGVESSMSVEDAEKMMSKFRTAVSLRSRSMKQPQPSSNDQSEPQDSEPVQESSDAASLSQIRSRLNPHLPVERRASASEEVSTLKTVPASTSARQQKLRLRSSSMPGRMLRDRVMRARAKMQICEAHLLEDGTDSGTESEDSFVSTDSQLETQDETLIAEGLQEQSIGMQDSTETDERRGNKPSLLSQAQSAKELKTPLVDNFLGSTLQPSDAAALAKLLSQSTDYGSGSSMRHYSGGSDWSMGAVDDTLDDGGGTSSPMARTATTTPSTDVGSLRIGSLLRTSTLSSSRFLVCRICEHKVFSEHLKQHSLLCARVATCMDQSVGLDPATRMERMILLLQEQLREIVQICAYTTESVDAGPIQRAQQASTLLSHAMQASQIMHNDPASLAGLDRLLRDIRAMRSIENTPSLEIDTFGGRIESLVFEQMEAREKRQGGVSAIRGEESVANSTTPCKRTTINDFTIMKALSQGAFGRVYLARKNATGDLFALKVLKKKDMIIKNMVDQVRAERDILCATRSPYVVRCFYSFTSEHNLYMVMEYHNGGDCAALIQGMGCLEEHSARQYIAEAVLALEYIHSVGIVHRDIKPDNFLIGSDGHIRLTDFGLSVTGLTERTAERLNPAHEPSKRSTQDSPLYTRRHQSGSSVSAVESPSGSEAGSPPVDRSSFLHSRSISGGQQSPFTVQRSGGSLQGRVNSFNQPNQANAYGTPDYLAPEILLGTSEVEQGGSVDWWSLGAMAYEFITGVPPFNAHDPQQIFNNILNRNLEWPSVPEDMSYEAKDLIDRLLCEDPYHRLGFHGAEEVKAHPFFAGLDWDRLMEQKATFVPTCEDAEDTSYFDERGLDGIDDARDEDRRPPGAPPGPGYAFQLPRTRSYSPDDVEGVRSRRQSGSRRLSGSRRFSEGRPAPGSASGSVSSVSSTSTLSEDLQEEAEQEMAMLEQADEETRNEFLNFSFKNLPQLASYNMDILTAVMENDNSPYMTPRSAESSQRSAVELNPLSLREREEFEARPISGSLQSQSFLARRSQDQESHSTEALVLPAMEHASEQTRNQVHNDLS